MPRFPAVAPSSHGSAKHRIWGATERRRRRKGSVKAKRDKAIEPRKSRVRCKVEHPFLIVKRYFGFCKAVCKGSGRTAAVYSPCSPPPASSCAHAQAGSAGAMPRSSASKNGNGNENNLTGPLRGNFSPPERGGSSKLMSALRLFRQSVTGSSFISVSLGMLRLSAQDRTVSAVPACLQILSPRAWTSQILPSGWRTGK